MIEELVGTWKNLEDQSLGWNFVSFPVSPGRQYSGFDFCYQRYSETLTIDELRDQPQNIGKAGTRDSWKGLSYNSTISKVSERCSVKQSNSLHHEVGYFLFQSNPGSGNTRVVRQGSIPRANAFLLSGDLSKENAASQTPDYVFWPYLRSGGRIRSSIQNKIRLITYGGNFPNGSDLAKSLREDIDEDYLTDQNGNIIYDWHVRFGSQPEGHILSHRTGNDPLDIGDMKCDMWLGQRNVNGVDTWVLQYIQSLNLEFWDMLWPHVSLNTLYKVT